jgi:hypothetical protein
MLLESSVCMFQLCVRCCDVSHGKAGEEMLRTILPVLLNSGICNPVSEVRAIRYGIFAIRLMVIIESCV